ncbi:MAG: spermine synthase [Chthoniobacterales bacterium]
MIPFRNLGEVKTPDGSRLILHEHDGEFFLKLNGRQLMSSGATTSELMLAEKACKYLSERAAPRVLIGGLGLGFSLKRTLEMMGKGGVVHVAELLPEVVQWNRELLGPKHAGWVNDPRVEVFVADVFAIIKRSRKTPYDAILLDVDNGPTSFVQTKNSRLYSRQGLQMIRNALQPDGRVAFWSAEREPAFVDSLSRAGFLSEEYPAKAHERAKREAHRIYVGERV